MKSRSVLLPVAAAALAVAFPVQSQTATKSSTAAKPATARTSTTARTVTTSSAVKLPPGIPPVHGIVRTALSLKYQDIKIGTGPVGEDGKVWHIKYTGWRAADGVKFDSWDEHKMPVFENGKPKTGPDGKPVFADPKPLEFLHGVGRMIPGFDVGVEGMRVGGKRRVFVPWAMAYGYRAIPDHGPEHPGIPAKSDLIFDVELVDVTDAPPPPAPPQRPGVIPGVIPGAHLPPSTPPTAPKPATPPQPATAAPATTAPAATPAPATTTPKPATPQSK